MPITEVRICEHCKKEVIGLCLCNHVPGTPINYSFPSQQETLLARYHSLWAELHAEQHATPKWFANWLARVPSNDCGCLRWLREHLKTNPPDYADFYEWGVGLHDAVSVKLGRAKWDRKS